MSTTSDFRTSDGLRDLLCRLNDGGHNAWRHNAEAQELMSFAMQKYAALAHKHGREPADAAVAAFEVMRTRAAREAHDPWAVVTRAVQLTLTYEAKADGLLCSASRARRPEWAKDRDPERFGDRETPITEYHPAFWIEPEQDCVIEGCPSSRTSTGGFDALDRAVTLFTDLGWPQDAARSGLEYICNRLMQTGSRSAAFHYLRRDRHARALLDLTQQGWIAMLQAVLGNQHPDRVNTCAGRGILLLLLIGYTVDELRAMPAIAEPVARGTQTFGAQTRV